jgi:hypothetical protein
MNSKSSLFSFCEHWWGIVSPEFPRDMLLNLGRWWLKWMFVLNTDFGRATLQICMSAFCLWYLPYYALLNPDLGTLHQLISFVTYYTAL